MQPIVFKKSPMTLAEFESVNKTHGRMFYKAIFSPGFVVLLVFIFVAYKYLLFNTGGSATPFDLLGTLQSLAIAALAIGVAFGLIKYLVDRGLKNAYHADPELADGFTYTLTEDSITIEGKLANRKQLKLKSFEQTTLIDNWLVLSSDNNRYYLDFEKLVPPATVTEVGELLQRNGVTIA